MISAGVLDKVDYLCFNEEMAGVLSAEEDAWSDEDVEIDLVEGPPAFLRGLTKHDLQISPVKIVKVRGKKLGWIGSFRGGLVYFQC